MGVGPVDAKFFFVRKCASCREFVCVDDGGDWVTIEGAREDAGELRFGLEHWKCEGPLLRLREAVRELRAGAAAKDGGGGDAELFEVKRPDNVAVGAFMRVRIAGRGRTVAVRVPAGVPPGGTFRIRLSA